jgi:uncharacterized protein
VGKTFAVRALAERQNVNLVEINFERREDFARVFENDFSPQRIISELEILLRIKIEVGKCILFFDEIQVSPRAIQSLRYFYEEMPGLHVASAGSLLEFALGNFSFPVGRVSFAWVFPLSFREFLGAVGHLSLAQKLPVFPTNREAIPSSLQNELEKNLKFYFLVGGMPEAVKVFQSTNSFLKVNSVHEEIATSFLDDIRKYAKGDKQLSNTRQLLSSVFSFVGKQINYTVIGNGDEIKRTKQSIDLLSQALLLHKVLKCSPAQLPLGATASKKQFKLIFLDIGLGLYLSGLNSSEVSQSEILRSNVLTGPQKGRLAEQFVGQELFGESVVGSEGRNLYYSAREAKNSSAEVDFVVARQGHAFPMEVKAGKLGTFKSLNLYLEKFGGQALVLQDRHDVLLEGAIECWPLYTKI